MHIPFLTTKFFIPPTHVAFLPRPHLLNKLDEGSGQFILVCASAGSGKTSLLSTWASRQKNPVAWVSLDEEDNDSITFITYLITAAERIRKNSSVPSFAQFDPSQTNAPLTILIEWINHQAERTDPLYIILDDFHLITNPETYHLINFLIDHLPPKIKLILSTRINPPFPLARYRAHGQLNEIRGHDLMFSEDETYQFFNHILEIPLTRKETDHLGSRVEGWAAGLQLTALSLRSQPDPSQFVANFNGSQQYIADFLIEEILKQQSPEIQTFLLQSSILQRMTASLCEAVTGNKDAREILNTLYQNNLFLIPLDNKGLWFRYHHLFAELLQGILNQSRNKKTIHHLHLRAAEWYEKQGLLNEAAHHAFSAGETDFCAELVEKLGQDIIEQDRFGSLQYWLDLFSPQIFQSHPRLEIYRLLLALNRGTLDMFEKTLVEKENLIKRLPSSPENDRLKRESIVRLCVFYAHQNTQHAIQLAQEILQDLPESEIKQRAYLYSAFYRAYGMEGNIQKSAPAYRECVRLSQLGGFYGMLADTTMVRTFDLCQYGFLDEALYYCQLILDAGDQSRQSPFYPSGQSLIGMAGVYLERFELDKAEELLTQGLTLCQQGAVSGLYTGYIQKIRLHQAKGELDQAVQGLLELQQYFQRYDFTLTARQVNIYRTNGNQAALTAIIPSLTEILQENTYAVHLPKIAEEAFKLSLARIYLTLGNYGEVKKLLNAIEPEIKQTSRNGRLIEIHLLRAIVETKQNRGEITNQALSHAEKALSFAAKSKMVLLFFEEGLDLLPILKKLITKNLPQEENQHLKRILRAFSTPLDSNPASGQELIEKLTPRETEILHLIAAGDSNQEIAQKLFITVRTVKKHSGNIYAKLNASSRTQAVAYAREIGLL